MFFNFVFLCLLCLLPVLAQYSKFCNVCKWTVISKKSGIKCEPSKHLIFEYDPNFFDQCPDLFKKNDNPHFFQFENLQFNDSAVALDFNFLSKVPDISSLEIRNSNLKNLVNASDSVLSEYKIRYSLLKNLTHISGIPSIIKHLDFEECEDFHLNLDSNKLKKLPEIKGEVNKISKLSIGHQQSDIWDSVDNFVINLKENLEITRIIFNYNNGSIFTPQIIKLLNTDRFKFDRIQINLRANEFMSIKINKFLSSLRPHSKILIVFRIIGEVETQGFIDEAHNVCSNTFLNRNVVINDCHGLFDF
ncbi:unnamed protein product [Brachionus calyciflorus]|uniref:Uncharacterized protein n=1 Tax=Brachionus calyciflorus TaxID=104777 RepID=A0A814G612_9BILA|nr:unnamed protein product [Brachionus calyciflorus]